MPLPVSAAASSILLILANFLRIGNERDDKRELVGLATSSSDIPSFMSMEVPPGCRQSNLTIQVPEYLHEDWPHDSFLMFPDKIPATKFC